LGGICAWLALCNFYWALQDMPMVSNNDHDDATINSTSVHTAARTDHTTITNTSTKSISTNTNDSIKNDTNIIATSRNTSQQKVQTKILTTLETEQEPQLYQILLKDTLQPFANVSTTFHSKVFKISQ